jgi:hypothetical protein
VERIAEMFPAEGCPTRPPALPGWSTSCSPPSAPRRCASSERCKERLIEIDHYGERLTGCLECNVWWGSKRAFIIELSVEDFEALRRLKTIGL